MAIDISPLDGLCVRMAQHLDFAMGDRAASHSPAGTIGFFDAALIDKLIDVLRRECGERHVTEDLAQSCNGQQVAGTGWRLFCRDYLQRIAIEQLANRIGLVLLTYPICPGAVSLR